MSKLKVFFEKNWPIIVFIIIAVPVVALAANVVEGGFRITRGSGDNVVVIDGRQVTFKTDSLADDIFIPTNSREEIDSFLASDLYIQLTGNCVPTTCNPYCGDDGCGGKCDCTSPNVCDSGTHTCMCAPTCAPGNTGDACGADNGCGGTCGCISPAFCDSSHVCASVCAPSCLGSGDNGSICGDSDGCGGTCGCSSPYTCFGGTCQNFGTCQPTCEGKGAENEPCGGEDGCGGVCGCLQDLSCDKESKTCVKGCTAKCEGSGQQDETCGGEDGCGGVCGCTGVLGCDPKINRCGIQPGCSEGREGSECGNTGEWGSICGCDTGLTCNSRNSCVADRSTPVESQP